MAYVNVLCLHLIFKTVACVPLIQWHKSFNKVKFSVERFFSHLAH